jgi:hypothetical protein
MSTTSSTRKRYNTRNSKQLSEEKELNTDLMSAYRTSSEEETSENNTPKNTKKVKTTVPDLMDTDNNFNNHYHPLDSETHENATSSTSCDQNIINQTPIGSLQQKLPNEVNQQKDANQNSTSKEKDDKIEHLELNISGDFEQGFVGYKAFIPRDNFSSKLSHKEIEKNIRNALVSEHSFTKLVCMSQSSYDFFVLTFNTKEKKEEYVNKGIKNVCEKLYNYDQTSFNNYIKLKLQNQDTYIIKIVDVPTNFDSSIVINHLINITGKKVKSYYDHIKTPNQPPTHTGK